VSVQELAVHLEADLTPQCIRLSCLNGRPNWSVNYHDCEMWNKVSCQKTWYSVHKWILLRRSESFPRSGEVYKVCGSSLYGRLFEGETDVQPFNFQSITLERRTSAGVPTSEIGGLRESCIHKVTSFGIHFCQVDAWFFAFTWPKDWTKRVPQEQVAIEYFNVTMDASGQKVPGSLSQMGRRDLEPTIILCFLEQLLRKNIIICI
jgi:hypothetical protein